MNLSEHANNMIRDLIIERLMEENNTDIVSARKLLSEMSFGEYYRLSEEASNIVPPSGNILSPTSTSTPTTSSTPQQNKPMNIYQGNGQPAVGMVAGYKLGDGSVAQGEIAAIDSSKNGVTIKDPTGNQQVVNIDTLTQPELLQQVDEDIPDLSRIKELAGIKENCSSGATGAGSIAVSAAPLGKMNRRNQVEESPSLEHPDIGTKTVVGDTKPNQASGKLSANLAARGQKTASRVNNGDRSRYASQKPNR